MLIYENYAIVTDVIENLRNKFPDGIFDRLAMKKQLYQ